MSLHLGWEFPIRKLPRILKKRITIWKLWYRRYWRKLKASSPKISSAEQPLRLKLFSHDQLERHARELAARHLVGEGVSKDLLLDRLTDNESVLLGSYKQLSEAVLSKKIISPASEWLLDNYHVIEEQILTARRHLPAGYSRELPHLVSTESKGYPRVYDIALEVIAHVDGRVDKENITSFVAAYQSVSKLNLGEIWAIPIMLRLALIENLRRVASRVVIALKDRDKANHWADLLIAVSEKEPKNLILVTADMARSKSVISEAFVAELVRRLQGQGQALDIPLLWIEQQLIENASTTQQMVHLESQQQAANQVSVGASVGSLRFLSSMNWRDFVESLSSIHKELCNDPIQAYQGMSFTTRDCYRQVVESIAKCAKRSEEEISQTAIRLATDAQGGARVRHVGYYLIGNGRRLLESCVQIKTFCPEFLRTRGRGRLAVFIGGIGAITVLLTSIIVYHLNSTSFDVRGVAVAAVLLLICSSQVAVALVNWLATLIIKPSLLPRLDFSEGIPPEHRTLVVIPSMLLSAANIASLLESLEVRFLANREQNLHYALLTDFADAKQETVATDAHLIELAVAGIKALNSKYSGDEAEPSKQDSFFLLHRAREWNPCEEVWMGKERKRGKLEALNRYLRNADACSFAVIVGNIHAFSPVKYVITLDTDTQMPRNAARELAGTIAHPLNRPFYDKELGRVTEGYTILQPRVAVGLPNSRNSWFVRLFSGDAGVDPYTRAVSDVYQDLFLEGSFVGKGIYDVDAFILSLSEKFPDNLILSHDLIEGCYGRCGLVSDVLLYEDFPANYSDDAKRRARWIRGDWQIIQWLLPRVPGPGGKSYRNPLSLLSRWKIFDNLRRSLVPIAVLLILIGSWFVGKHQVNPWYLTEVILMFIFIPQLLTSMAEAARRPKEVTWRAHSTGVLNTLGRQFLQALLAVVLLPYEATLHLIAPSRSLVRIFITHKHLLEWRSASDARDTAKKVRQFYSLMVVAPVLAILLTAVFWYQDMALGLPALFLVPWFFSPAVAAGLSRRLPDQVDKLNETQTLFLRRLSRKAWLFFETFVGPDENWLPPDNFQEYPEPVIAHRTSPTNIGLSLVANLSAYDFGYLSADGLKERTLHTFATMDKLERFRGHFYNWYETQYLSPLPPLYVSTVDSGNLVGMLLTLRQGLLDLPNYKVIPAQICSGLTDTLNVLAEHTGSLPGNEAIQELLSHRPDSLYAAKQLHENLTNIVSTLAPVDPNPEVKSWSAALLKQSRTCLLDSQAFLDPLMQLKRRPDSINAEVALTAFIDRIEAIPTWAEAAQFELQVSPLIDSALQSSGSDEERAWYLAVRNAAGLISNAARVKIQACESLAQRCADLATIEYEFLYDRSHQLLAIGYNVSEHRRDSGFYDLLASEARLGSFVAIAKGCLPQEHWFSLGRQLTTWHNQSTLLSWSGSMFEYLMPLLVMPTFKNTLLDETYHTSVKRQIAYGKEHKIPWGISESGYNTTDMNLNYQYRAFGVPGLGFKRGLADDLVLAPYASVMAVMIAPEEATNNMLNMAAQGFEGRYGFYEAVDYTPARLGTGQNHAIVRSFMAHHLGMSFLSLAYRVLGPRMQTRFLQDPHFQATEMLLHERIPRVAMLYPHAPEVAEPQRGFVEARPALRVIDTANTQRPEVHLLSNGRYNVMITNSGGGYSRWKDLALTRWREDPTCDDWGSFCYLRDMSSGEVWSTSHQPTLKVPTHYEAIFPQARAEFRRRDHGIELHTEITISPEDDIELRRCSITNLSSSRRVIEFTTYAEVVLAPQVVDEAHQAFSNLFVQTELLRSKQAILCKRRPRSDSEQTPTLFHQVTVHGTQVGGVTYETDRSRFIGRGRSANDPVVFSKFGGSEGNQNYDLTGQSGSVLDPIVAIRCRVALEPEETAFVHIVTGVGEKREDALELIEKYFDRHLADRVFELAWTHRQVVLRQLNVTEADAQLYGRLASSVIYANPIRRARPSELLKNRRGQSGLWGYGISGDLPIVLLRVGSEDHSVIVRQLVQAHGYWRQMGLAVDLVIWNEDQSGYRQDLQERIVELIAEGSYLQQVDKPGGIFVRRSDQLSEEDQTLLLTVARAVITDTGGALADQIKRRPVRLKPVAAFVPTQTRAVATSNELSERPPLPVNLLFSNGTGGFSPDGREYVIATSDAQVTPAPWSNVLANPYFGTVVSESGSAYTWCENAHEYRLTPWFNDALTDRSGEAFFFRDENTGAFWSPTPLPARAEAPYLTRHGFGYSKFETVVDGIESELTTFVAADAPIKINLIKIRNITSETRQLSVTGYCEWVLGELRSKSLMHIVSEVDAVTNAIFLRNPYHPEFGGRLGFFSVSEAERTLTGDRSEFLGRNGNLSSPLAMFRKNLSGRVGAGLDSCSAMQANIVLNPGEERELVFVLGVARDVEDARTLLHRFATPDMAQEALKAVGLHWDNTLGAIQIKTPDASLDVLMNGWLMYQVLSSRLWGRSGYYQSGGAYGFRDQLQDTMAVMYAQPQLLRQHLLRCASRQYREGDVQHWWHPPSGFGVRTHFSDDYLWMPLAVCRYVLGTGDTGILEKRINFIEGRQVNVNEEAYSELPSRSDESATLYDHCVRALRHALKFGRNGLPLMGCGDWNDGMNLVGEHGKGESVWLAFFLCNILEKFSKVAEIMGDAAFVKTCITQAEVLKHNIAANGWDGEWYLRAFFDSGEPLGSSKNSECQIDSLPQSWAVLSGIGDPKRAQLAMERVYERLVDQESRLIKLFDPPFDRSQPNPGYIKGYVPGVRENGGQYTHAAIWTAMAFAKLGDQKRAWELLGMINPLHHGDSAEKIKTYKVEPYVVAADVYAVAPHTGRGGWTWYTGSAGWLYRFILESLLGMKLVVDRLSFTPCIPPEWQEFSLRYRYRETFYDITVTPATKTSVVVDGVLQEGESFLLVDDRAEHKVRVGVRHQY